MQNVWSLGLKGVGPVSPDKTLLMKCLWKRRHSLLNLYPQVSWCNHQLLIIGISIDGTSCTLYLANFIIILALVQSQITTFTQAIFDGDYNWKLVLLRLLFVHQIKLLCGTVFSSTLGNSSFMGICQTYHTLPQSLCFLERSLYKNLTAVMWSK